MARWTNWRKIADRSYWYAETLDWDGPACYELALAGTRGGALRVVYVGETVNEMKRLLAYAKHGSHLSKIIDAHLVNGWHLHYRARAADTKEAAVKTQDWLLARYDYDWNIKLNTWGK